MSGAAVLMQAAANGFEVSLRDDGTPALKGEGQPNAALMAALREHRGEIIRLLGGTPEPETCGECRAYVYEPVDLIHWCDRRKCVYRLRVRGHG